MDNSKLIRCPSCGHENAPSVEKCILCDFALGKYLKQSGVRHMHNAQYLNDETVGHANKRLGPLPQSDQLIDKQKSRRADTAKIQQCDECGTANRSGTLLCTNCGARINSTEVVLSAQASDMRDTQEEMAIIEDEPDTQSVLEFDNSQHHSYEMPILSSKEIGSDVADIPIGCIKFASWMILQLDVLDSDVPIVVRPLEDKPMLIGRRHESLQVQPQIDLTHYLSDRHGVSRRHAMIRLRGNRLELQDLNSTNGTSINGVRFSPKESHQLRHQDVILLGQVPIYVTFAPRVKSAKHGHTEDLGTD